MSKPLVSFATGPFSVALFQNDNGKSVSVRKSYRKGEEFEEMKLTLWPQEVACLRELLGRMEQAVISEKGDE